MFATRHLLGVFTSEPFDRFLLTWYRFRVVMELWTHNIWLRYWYRCISAGFGTEHFDLSGMSQALEGAEK